MGDPVEEKSEVEDKVRCKKSILNVVVPLAFVVLVIHGLATFWSWLSSYMDFQINQINQYSSITQRANEAQRDVLGEGDAYKWLLEKSVYHPKAAEEIAEIFESKGDFQGRDRFLIQTLNGYPDVVKAQLFDRMGRIFDPAWKMANGSLVRTYDDPTGSKNGLVTLSAEAQARVYKCASGLKTWYREYSLMGPLIDYVYQSKSSECDFSDI